MNKIRLGIFAATCLCLSGCAGVTRISQIEADPLRFRTHSVRVQGVVTQSAGVFKIGEYQMSDGTGKIFVITSAGLPPKGAHVLVQGHVVNGVTVGTRSFGTAIKEDHQKVQP